MVGGEERGSHTREKEREEWTTEQERKRNLNKEKTYFEQGEIKGK